MQNAALSPQERLCIRMGSEASHLNFSLIVCVCWGGGGRKVTKNVSINHSFRKEGTTDADSNRRPSAYQPTAFQLGHTHNFTFASP